MSNASPVSLAEAYVRLKRASELIREAKALYASFLGTYGEATILEPRTSAPVQGGQIAAWGFHLDTTKVPAVPVELPIRIGEAIYNLRAALDYMIGNLSRLDSPQFQRPRRTQFPIESAPAGFASRRQTFLAGVSDEHVADLQELQPFAGCSWTSQLADLSNLAGC